MQKRKLWFGLAGLAAAWSFDFLFWGNVGGISYLIWTTLLLVLGYLLAWREKKKPSIWSIVLTVLILAFASVSAFRSEGFTRFTSIAVSLAGLMLLITTFTDGYWLFYRIVDYIVGFAKTIWAGMSRGFLLLRANDEGVPPLPGQKTGMRRLGSVFLGLVIALPIILILGAILASADPVFSNMIKKIFSLENLPEYLFRFLYVVFFTYVFLGFLLHAILPFKAAEKPDPQKAILSPFLGMTEGSIVLGAIDILFIAFVIIQVRYLFGGTANISETGYTYSEYARRGFSELVAVAVLTLAIYLVMHTITKRETKGKKVTFTVLSVVMLANVLVILASSLQRLMLYESAYQFSEQRTYTHVFIFWLAALILAAIIFQLLNRQGRFGLALLVMVVGFTVTLAAMNVDGFVAQQNIQTARVEGKLDTDYLSSLSNDAVPELIRGYLAPGLSPKDHTNLGVLLACRTKDLKDPLTGAWQSLRFSELSAYRLLQQNSASWSQYVVTTYKHDVSTVTINNTEYDCPYIWSD
jgi:hypothetical protein